VGSEGLKEYAVVGGPVNVAARVEGLTREYQTDILLTEDLKQTLDPRFALRRVASAELRGIARPLTVFAVEGVEP
jgi:adenylate cyclase